MFTFSGRVVENALIGVKYVGKIRLTLWLAVSPTEKKCWEKMMLL